ncbi:hypothetical protein BACCAP_03394 [Pseudoflavonifractor capillosus ATCC 29799]|uniref:MATE domain protein n=1 Tax=Pseudoflavonifractor capillosus ATCC 29799 TaxID=411467 RepID=A6NYU3_9FIRM|nr:hypothetical protein BACCAP_03394 [Pseudoflavonifractor capillosus ATCC 29799]
MMDKQKIYPRSKDRETVYLKNVVTDPSIIVGDYTMYNDFVNDPVDFQKNMGKPSKSMFLMIFYYIVVRMPLAYLLSYLGFGLNGIWVAVLISHVVASAAASISGTISFKKRLTAE